MDWPRVLLLRWRSSTLTFKPENDSGLGTQGGMCLPLPIAIPASSQQHVKSLH